MPKTPKTLFGPAGNSDSFTKSHKSSAFAPAWLREMGLDCYEYQCGRGVNISHDTAAKIGKQAAESGIAMSLHSPYFINLSSRAPERMEKNMGYILSAFRAASWLGADRVVVHCGGLSGMGRAEAFENTRLNLLDALARLDFEGLGHIAICVETMGKVSTIGSVQEVAALCATDSRLVPCVDFGHVNSREGGSLKTTADFLSVLDTLENHIGAQRTRLLHVHFSKIEYSAGGEVRHLTFDSDSKGFGPHYEPMLEAMVIRGCTPRIICESAGTQAEDAMTMKRHYMALISSDMPEK